MSDHRSFGVIFGPEMVRALLAPPDRRKSVTRRIGDRWARVREGDHLWVRESHALTTLVHWPDLPHRCTPGYPAHPRDLRPADEVAYYAAHFDRSPLPWRSPLFLPKWAARIHLRVVNVSQVPLDHISTHEAYKEGVFGTREEPSSREVFLKAFRELHPDLPWVEYNGLLFTDRPVWVWRVEFRQWEYSDGCPWRAREHDPIPSGSGEISCPSCGLVGMRIFEG